MLTVVGVVVLTLIAGFVPAVLFFQTTRPPVVLGLGLTGVVLSWLLIGITPLPPVVIVWINGAPIYPFWSGLMAFVAGAVAQAAVNVQAGPSVTNEVGLLEKADELPATEPEPLPGALADLPEIERERLLDLQEELESRPPR